jgi:SAM-dependent methyltransferase
MPFPPFDGKQKEATMDKENGANEEQALLWNDQAGRAWVEEQSLLDRLLEPVEALLAEAAAGARRVVDVGCGTGATTLAIARRLAPGGDCLGIDISAPVIAAARDRAALEAVSARFVCADAQTHAFEAAQFDAIVSRFGVMFFGDPVRAFANLRAAARDDARMTLVTWRSAEENPFMTTAERAAAPLLPEIPAREPGAPGQFAFADPGHVQGILAAAGWTGVELAPFDFACTMREDELATYFTRLGPLARALPQADAPTQAEIVRTVRAAFDPYVEGDRVRFTAACWTVRARAA